ncbi:MAG TPA: FUN14 domain-containing protein [Deinococcales bacterium]|nr:FUN14 domain-containing protein [Deinococcales bacterium]
MEGDLGTLLGPMAGQLGFGALAGFCSGYALKRIGRAVAFTLGLIFILLQVLASLGYIHVDWLRIQSAADPYLNPKGLDSLWKGLVGLLTTNLPFAAAFIPGLLFGLRRG